MARRAVNVLLCLTFLLGFAGAATAYAAVPPAGGVVTARNGIDPAEKAAVNGTLTYHEKRAYPYSLIVFLVVMTPVALVAIRRWAPKMEGETE